MARKAGYGTLQFEKIGNSEFEDYVLAIQAAADQNYQLMEKFITFIFPD